jgi:predicted nuclease with RNAse H fold
VRFAGIDVGGRRKGFHAAAVSADRRLIAGPRRIVGLAPAVAWLEALRPAVVAIDSPMRCAPSGERSRPGERALAKEVCGIRFTPEESRLADNPYYEWIRCGLDLYRALRRAVDGWEVIEVFPTASWTVWAEARGTRSRARWTRDALEAMGLEGLPDRSLGQDDRDAIAAALTARFHARGETRQFDEIVVPLARREMRVAN